MKDATRSAGRHSLSNIDRENRTADCAACGPSVRIRVRVRQSGGGVDCRASRRSGGDRRGQYLREKYGISRSDYDLMYAAQGGACAICAVGHAVLCVDHCHTTGRVRGLLCASCNTALGHLRDDPTLLRRAISYLGG